MCHETYVWQSKFGEIYLPNINKYINGLNILLFSTNNNKFSITEGQYNFQGGNC